MPGRRATKLQVERFWKLITEGGMSPRRAGVEIGMSENWGYREYAFVKGSAGSRGAESRLLSEDLPDPKTFDQLSADAKESLRDFAVFSELFLARRPAAWRLDAAQRVLDALLDKEERSYIVANVFPGSGKTTLFTCDIPAWLLAGGGTLDTSIGRALRMMLGSETKQNAEHNLLRLRRILDLRRPFYDKKQKRYAQLVLAHEFGRFRPSEAAGDESIWRNDQFLVAQLSQLDLYEKEPTVQTASRESGFLGERVDLAVWDDLVTSKTARNLEVTEAQAEWFEDEAETRVEPGGALFLVGQRLSSTDLYRNRLDITYQTEAGEDVPKYTSVIYPAHNVATCDDNHRQWDLAADGCLLDEHRLPWREVLKLRGSRNWRTVFQQEDADPSQVLVRDIWLDGGVDIEDGYPAPGSFDRDRGFLEWPKNVSGLIDYVCIDPAATGWWALEWWAVQPETRYRYLIYGFRKRLQAGDMLDFDPRLRKHVGWLERLQLQSHELGHPIKVWVLETNYMAKHMTQYDHYRTWRQKWPQISVISHETQRNKLDPVMGVEVVLPLAYRAGWKRLPYKGLDCLNYIASKRRELTSYIPGSKRPTTTTDTVMADWFGEFNLERIVRAGVRAPAQTQTGLQMPAYLQRQVHTYDLQTGKSIQEKPRRGL